VCASPPPHTPAPAPASASGGCCGAQYHCVPLTLATRARELLRASHPRHTRARTAACLSPSPHARANCCVPLTLATRARELLRASHPRHTRARTAACLSSSLLSPLELADLNDAPSDLTDAINLKATIDQTAYEFQYTIYT